MGEQGLAVHEEEFGMGQELAKLVKDAESVCVEVTPIEEFPVVQPFDVGEVPEAASAAEVDGSSGLGIDRFWRQGKVDGGVTFNHRTCMQRWTLGDSGTIVRRYSTVTVSGAEGVPLL